MQVAATSAPSDDRLLITATEAQRHLGNVSRRTLHNWIRDKGLPAVKLGALLRFRLADLSDWVDRQQAATASNLGTHDASADGAISQESSILRISESTASCMAKAR